MADDLFSHADQQEALDAVIAAEKARLQAREKVLYAPRGKAEERRRQLVEETRRALAAESDLTKLGGGHLLR